MADLPSNRLENSPVQKSGPRDEELSDTEQEGYWVDKEKAHRAKATHGFSYDAEAFLALLPPPGPPPKESLPPETPKRRISDVFRDRLSGTSEKFKEKLSLSKKRDTLPKGEQLS